MIQFVIIFLRLLIHGMSTPVFRHAIQIIFRMRCLSTLHILLNNLTMNGHRFYSSFSNQTQNRAKFMNT